MLDVVKITHFSILVSKSEVRDFAFDRFLRERDALSLSRRQCLHMCHILPTDEGVRTLCEFTGNFGIEYADWKFERAGFLSCESGM